MIETNSHTNITVSDKGMNDEERQLPPIENDDRVTAQDKMVPQAGNNGINSFLVLFILFEISSSCQYRMEVRKRSSIE